MNDKIIQGVVRNFVVEVLKESVKVLISVIEVGVALLHDYIGIVVVVGIFVDNFDDFILLVVFRVVKKI